jgi:hypothetical protein
MQCYAEKSARPILRQCEQALAELVDKFRKLVLN